jgi:hypothetical protein
MSAYTYHWPLKSNPVSMKIWIDHVWHPPRMEYWSWKTPHMNTGVYHILFVTKQVTKSQNRKARTPEAQHSQNINVKCSQCAEPRTPKLWTARARILGFRTWDSILEMKKHCLKMFEWSCHTSINIVLYIHNHLTDPQVPSTGYPELGTRDSGQYVRWKRHMSNMFESPLGIYVNIVPNPEPQNCVLPGLGVQGSGVRVLGVDMWGSTNV